jgi:hypothetical protein
MIRRGVVHVVTVVALGAAAGLGASAARLLPAAAPCRAASYSGHVTLMVEHGDGQVIGLCIGFDGGSITGEQILQASGLEYAAQSYGSLGDAVCQIDGEPTAYSSCLPGGGSYWALFVARGGGSWQEASSGISSETFTSGDAEGFRYDPQDGPDPPPPSPAGICAAALATPSVAAAASGSGSSGGAPPPASQPSVTSAASAAPTPATLPAPAVIAAGDQGHLSATASTARTPSAGLSPALLVVAAVLGALAGLLVVQMALRRRRA